MHAKSIGRGLAAATSVVLSAVVAVGVNIATGHPSFAVIAGLVILVAVWAAFESWQALHPDRRAGSDRHQASVVQRVRVVAGLGRLVGVTRPAADANVTVNQHVGEVTDSGEVIGYNGDTAL